ncbi:MAG: hypothetical protein ACRDIE_13860 [Chloroflexota bacterium]
MPLLSRLFGRKQRQDDEQTSRSDQSLVFRPITIAQPIGDRPLDAPAAVATPSNLALPGEPEEAAQEGAVEAPDAPDQAFEVVREAQGDDARAAEPEPAGNQVEVEAELSQASEAADAATDARRVAAESFDQFAQGAPAAEDYAAPFATLSEESSEVFAKLTAPPLESSTASGNPFAPIGVEAPVAQPGFDKTADPHAEAEEKPVQLPVTGRQHLDLVQSASAGDNGRLTTFAVPPASVEPKTLIGGKEEDLVPLIPDTEADEAESTELDETGMAEAAVDSLKEACDVLVAQVKKLRTQQDAARVVAGMITLVGELDTRYARDMGVTRRNGVEEVLQDVRGTMAEGDRFVLESLENGRGGLTADSFLHDLKTIAPSDRPRLLGHYITFLAFMIKRVLHQYLRPLEEDETRTYEISYHLDYLVEGVRDVLVAKVTAPLS